MGCCFKKQEIVENECQNEHYLFILSYSLLFAHITVFKPRPLVLMALKKIFFSVPCAVTQNFKCNRCNQKYSVYLQADGKWGREVKGKKEGEGEKE